MAKGSINSATTSEGRKPAKPPAPRGTRKSIRTMEMERAEDEVLLQEGWKVVRNNKQHKRQQRKATFRRLKKATAAAAEVVVVGDERRSRGGDMICVYQRDKGKRDPGIPVFHCET